MSNPDYLKEHPAPRPVIVDPDDPGDITEIHDAERAAAHLHVIGEPNQSISKRLGLPPATVKQYLSDPAVRAYISYLERLFDQTSQAVMARLAEEQIPSLERLVEIRDSSKASPSLVASICQDLLDRGGHGKVQRTESKTLSANLDSDTIRQLVEEGRQLVKGAGASKEDTTK